MRRLAVALALGSTLVLASCSGAGAPSAQNGSDIGFIPGGGTVVSVKPADRKAAPDLTGDKVGGGTLALSDYRGKVVVLNVWGSWCAPCREETPALVAADKELAKSGVAFVGINTKDNDAAAAAFQSSHDVPYPSFYDPDGHLLLQLRDSVPPKSIPSTVVVDSQGRYAAVVVGGVTQRSLSDIVGKVLLESARASASPTPTGKPTA